MNGKLVSRHLQPTSGNRNKSKENKIVVEKCSVWMLQNTELWTWNKSVSGWRPMACSNTVLHSQINTVNISFLVLIFVNPTYNKLTWSPFDTREREKTNQSVTKRSFSNNFVVCVVILERYGNGTVRRPRLKH